jgi:ubiquinol-cytochrome c reductase cytochrome b subunit
MALAPVAGEGLAALARGGPEIGALTLTRWYSAHVVLLPAALAALVVVHLFLMRRHGISGPVEKKVPDTFPFYPYQAARDVTVASAIAVALVALAWRGMPALEAPADPTDATYTPRPEWYFLGLFQLLKYFPGRLELVGAIVIPGLLLLALALLPWLDRRPERDPRRRTGLLAGVAVASLAIVVLTAAGWRDRPLHGDAWTARPIAGSVWIARAGCDRCHGDAGMTDAVGASPLARPPAWLASHVVDPEVIAPGLRPAPKVDQREVDAIVAYVRRVARGERAPQVSDTDRAVALVFARHCVGCHRLDGDGGSQSDDDGPDLSHAGAKRDAAWLRRWIADPEAMDPDAEMPGFDSKLTAAELDLISSYFAARK